MAIPRGLTDTTLDFKRGADAPEFSNNDSVNYTLNTDYWLGEHQLSATSSYIDYELDELLDADFTAAPLLISTQNEQYTQLFQRLDYTSPEGYFLEVEAGASYLKSKLTFASETRRSRLPTRSMLDLSAMTLRVMNSTGRFSPESVSQETQLNLSHFERTWAQVHSATSSY